MSIIEIYGDQGSMGWGELIMESRDKKMLVTMSLTRGEWFWRLMKGNNMWTEFIRRREFDLSMEALHDLWKALEIYWK